MSELPLNTPLEAVRCGDGVSGTFNIDTSCANTSGDSTSCVQAKLGQMNDQRTGTHDVDEWKAVSNTRHHRAAIRSITI
jgi:hypothetical protein